MTDTHNNHDDAPTHCALKLMAWYDAYGAVEAEEERLLREEATVDAYWEQYGLTIDEVRERVRELRRAPIDR
jgi:hypothetical protein